MPHAVVQSSPELAIVLDQRTAFMGGDTVSGHVIRKSHFVDTNASVVVSIFGRAKARFTVSSGMTHRVCRSCFYFFHDTSEARKIYQGPLHIPSDSSGPGKWPFSITLPEQPSLTSLRRDNPDEKTYVPLNDVSLQALPPSFLNKRDRFIGVYVEYYLKATLRGGGKNKPSQAIRPIIVRPISSPNPIADFALMNRSDGNHKIVSQRLVPGMEDARLSLGQKMKKTFSLSQVPAFVFSLDLDVPSIVQMDNPSTVPFQVRANPLWEETSEILQNTPQLVIVKQFTLKLQAMTHFTSKCMIWDEIDHKTSIILRSYNRRSQPPAAADNGNTKAREARADQPPNADTLIVPIGGESPPLDLGRALGIKVRATACKVVGTAGDTGIYPTFTTCHIKHVHRLVWELTLTIAEETVKFEGKLPVTLMGPSYDQEVRG